MFSGGVFFVKVMRDGGSGRSSGGEGPELPAEYLEEMDRRSFRGFTLDVRAYARGVEDEEEKKTLLAVAQRMLEAAAKGQEGT